MLRMTMKTRPRLSDQKDSFSGVSFHLRAGLQHPQAKEREPEAEHSVDTEERGVAVDGRQVEALHVVEGDGRIDEEAEEAGSDQVPEGNRDEEVDGPFVVGDPRRFSVGCARRMFSHAS